MGEGTRQLWAASGRLPEGLIYPELVYSGLSETLELGQCHGLGQRPSGRSDSEPLIDVRERNPRPLLLRGAWIFC